MKSADTARSFVPLLPLLGWDDERHQRYVMTSHQLWRCFKTLSKAGLNVDESNIDNFINLRTAVRYYHTSGPNGDYKPGPNLKLGDGYSIAIVEFNDESMNKFSSQNDFEWRHGVLRITLDTDAGQKYLKAVPIGRLIYNQMPTFWVIFLDSCANLYALRAEKRHPNEWCVCPAEENEDEEEHENGDRPSDGYSHTCIWPCYPSQSTRAFGRDKSLRAVKLGSIDVIEPGAEREILEYVPLADVVSWHSETFVEGDDLASTSRVVKRCKECGGTGKRY